MLNEIMNLEAAKDSFKNLLKALNNTDRVEFLLWCEENFTDSKVSNAYFDLRTIAEDIKSLLPVKAILPSEKVYDYQVNEQSTDPSLHVDSFLFEDEHIDSLVDEGKLKRNYCQDCKSFNVSPINFISHSSSIPSMEYIFKTILPDLNGRVFLDVGSRLGALLYGAYYLSAASKIIGVEMNEDLCKLQNHIINKYDLNNRIEVICSNICNVPAVVQSANVIAFNNVFECFMPIEVQQKVWQWLRNTITTPGTILVTIPSIEATLRNLNTGIDISRWLRQVAVAARDEKDDPNLIEETCCYVVL